MQVTFWGVRGSIPTPELDHLKWGGNTSCVEVQANGHRPVVFDSGTGIRRLGASLMQRGVDRVEVLVSHCHIDHILGLPFFAPLHVPGMPVRLSVPADSTGDAEQKLGRYFDGVLSPLRLDDLGADVTIAHVEAGVAMQRHGLTITACPLNHPGGSMAYRVQADDVVFCYVTDTAPLAPHGSGTASGQAPSPAEAALIETLRGADMVLFDTMFTQAEFEQRMDWGHSYPEYAVALCEAAGVAELFLFHHLPQANDERLDALASKWDAYDGPLRVRVAREGSSVTVGHLG